MTWSIEMMKRITSGLLIGCAWIPTLALPVMSQTIEAPMPPRFVLQHPRMDTRTHLAAPAPAPAPRNPVIKLGVSVTQGNVDPVPAAAGKPRIAPKAKGSKVALQARTGAHVVAPVGEKKRARLTVEEVSGKNCKCKPALAAYNRRDYATAARLYREAALNFTEAYGKEEVGDIGNAWVGVARSHECLEQYAIAEPAYRKALTIYTRLKRDTSEATEDLANILYLQKKYTQAAPYAREAVALYKQRGKQKKAHSASRLLQDILNRR